MRRTSAFIAAVVSLDVDRIMAVDRKIFTVDTHVREVWMSTVELAVRGRWKVGRYGSLRAGIIFPNSGQMKFFFLRFNHIK